MTIYFSNNKGWSGVNAHMWNDATGVTTTWPGNPGTLFGKNDFGEEIYTLTIDTGVYDSVIFNGTGGQTTDVAVADIIAGGNNALYCLDDSDSVGFLVAFYYFDPASLSEPDPTIPGGDPTTAPEDPTTAPEPSYADGYYLVGTINDWTPNEAYLFTASTDGNYALSTTLSVTDSLKVVKVVGGALATWYPDGMNNDYVVDAAHAGEVTVYFNPTAQAAWSEFGNYMYIEAGSVIEPTTTPDPTTVSDPTTAPEPGEEVTIYFSNNKGWGGVNAHMWNTATGVTTTWPGNPGTLFGKNDYNEEIYTLTIDTGVYDSVIFNGSGGQTTDVAVADIIAGGNNALYCLDTSDSVGFLVAFYYFDPNSISQTDPTTSGSDPTTAPSASALTLKPNSDWTSAGARFAAYFFNDSANEWYDMTSNGDGTYSVEVPSGYTKVIFCRMNGSTTENNWNNKWNQTDDLTISGYIGKTYNITGWDKSGYWS